MSYSNNCKMCQVCRYTRKHFKNFVIKTLCIINALSLLYWLIVLDGIASWQPLVIMTVNLSFLLAAAYVNLVRGDIYEL